MGSLFWKIFTWFWIAMISIGITVGWGVKLYVEYGQQDHREQLPKVQVEAISLAIQQSGPQAAIQLLNSLNEHSGYPVFILNDKQQDVLDRPLPDYIRHPLMKPHPNLRVIRKNVSSPDGQTFKIIAPFPKYLGTINWQSGYSRIIASLIALVISALVCLGLARYITAPVKKLSLASRKIANGELNIRVAQTCRRKDEITDLSSDFNTMAARLQKLIHAQAQLFSDISHELRSPLTRLQMAIALSQKDLENSKEFLKFATKATNNQFPDYQRHQSRLVRIQKDIDRIDQLIGQILTLSKLETTTELNYCSFLNLSELISEIIADAQLEAQEKPCHIDFLPQNTPSINGDRELLHRAIENIIRNAIYYTDPGTTISVSLKASDTDISIEVCDQGPGVAEEHLESIFEPFIRTDQAREGNTGGYGLGMAIAKRATQAHRGSIRADLQHPTGLCVKITLPLSKPV